MVRDRNARLVARAVRAAANVELARLQLEAIQECAQEFETGQAWTRCRLIAGHDQGQAPTKHRGPGGVEW